MSALNWLYCMMNLDQILAQSSLRPRGGRNCRVQFYMHILLGVRDGRRRHLSNFNRLLFQFRKNETDNRKPKINHLGHFGPNLNLVKMAQVKTNMSCSHLVATSSANNIFLISLLHNIFSMSVMFYIVFHLVPLHFVALTIRP